MRFRQINLRKLWLSLLLLVGVTAIAVPGIQEVMDGNVAKIGNTEYVTLQEAVDDAYANMTGDVTITLTSDITANTVVRQKQGMNLTIDGGNNTITGQILIYGGGFYGTDVLNIKNIKFTGSTTDFVSGKDAFVEIPAPNSLPAPYAVSGLSDAHNITVSDCSFISTSSSLNVVGFRSNSGTQCENLNLCGITGTNLHSLAQITGTNGGSVIGCSVDNSDSFVNVNGGKGDFTISGNTFTSSVSDGYAIRENGESTANITLSDNTFSAYKSIQMGKNSATKGTIKVESGNYNGIIVMSTTSTGTVSITGGTFSQPVDEYITAAGYGSFGNADGTFTVKEGTAVAAIGDKKFETLETTFAAAQDGETIKLLADCAGNGIQVLPNRFTETGLTVDFDGHTYTVDGDLTGSTGTQTQAFQLQMNNKITFQNGTIYSEKAKFLVNNYSDLTLDGMTLTLKNANYSSGYTLSNNNGNVVINNSTINANPAGKFAFDVCRGGGGATTYKSVHVTVTGNSVINGDIEIDAKNGDASDGFGLMLQGGTHTGNIVLTANAKAAMEATPDKALIQKSDSYEQDAPTGFKWVSNGIGLSTLTPRDPVAKIGDEIYYSLADAVAAVPTNGTQTTITMIADETVADQKITIAKTQNVVLDLNGKTITATGGDTNNGFYFITNNGTLEVTDNSTDKDGKITYACANPNTGYSKEYVTLYNHGTLTLTAGTIENTGKYLSYAVNTSSNAWGTGDDKNCVFNMTGGKVLCPQGDQSLRVYQNCAATNSPVSKNTVNISGGYIDNGIFLDDYLYTTNQNLTNYTGENIDTKVNISGGTINGLIDLKIRHPFNTLLNITGGDFTNAKMWVRKVDNEYANVCGEPTAPMVTISGGKFDFAGENTFGLAYEYATTTWTSYEKPYDISGGVFDQPVPAEFCAEGYAPADNTDTATKEAYPNTVLELPDVAQIGDVKYKSLAEAVAAVPTNGTETTITMIANEMINVSGYAITIPATKNVVLDLNGFQVVGTAEGGSTSALITNNGTLTIKDSSDTNKDGTGTGKLISGASTTWTWDGTDDYTGSYASNLIRNEKDLIVESGYLYNLSTGSASYAIDNYSAGNVTINGGKVDAAKASAIRMFYVDGGSITVTGGVVGHYTSDDDCTLYGIQVMSGSNVNVTIKGGTIAGQYAFYANNTGGKIDISDGAFDGYVGFGSAGPSDISISGGSFNAWVGTWGEQTKFISGGIYAVNVEEEYIADGFILADNTDEATKVAYPKAVREAHYVAEIVGGTKYETLEAAFAAAADGNTVTLLTNVELTERLFVNAGATPEYAANNRYATTSENKSITLDLNGYNVTGSSNIALAGGSLNIINNGTADAEHGVISTSNSGLSPIEVRGTGDLTSKRTLTVGTGVILSGAEYGLNVFGSNDAQKNIIDVNVNGTVNGTLFVLGNLSNAENEININIAGTVYVPDNGDDKANVGVALNGNATVNVNEDAQVSGETGIEVRAGKLNVNGGNITATASTYSEKKNSSGSATKGAAIAVAQHTTKLPITTTVNGCTLTGTKTLVVTDVEEIGLNDVTVKAADALANAETVVIPAGYKWVSDGTMSTLTPCDYVAQIEGGAKYETLEEAFAAAADDATITLLTNVELTDRLFVNAGATPAYAGSNNRYATTTEDKSITLDLNGYNITSSSNIALAGGSLNIINNGTADETHGVISTSNSGLSPIEVRGTGDLTSKRTLIVGTGVTLSGAEYGLNIFGSNDAQKNIIDVNINGTVNGTVFILGNLKNTENEININVAGTVYVPDNGDDKANVGVALNGNATVNVNEDAQVSGETGIEVRAGKLNVNGGNITATASTYSEKKNSSGSATKGAAIAVAQHTTKLPITTTVNGGTLTGTKTLVVTDVEEIGLNDVTVKAADALANAETVVIPEGYVWLSNGAGMSTLTKIEDGEYKLIDGKDYPFMNLKSDISVPEVTYQRSFSSTQVGKHQAWFVPMDYYITAEDVENFTFYKLHMVAGAAEAAPEAGEADPNKMYLYVESMKVGDKLVGNRPYTVKPKKAVTDYVFTAENTTLYALNSASRLNLTTSTHSYDFFGKYINETYSGAVGDWFSLTQGALHPNPASTRFLPYRWIFTVSSNTTNDGYSKIGFVIVEDADATSISTVNANDEVEGYYTVNGVRSETPVKGMNIVKYKNGKTKKIMIK